jgi:hypothetical protein
MGYGDSSIFEFYQQRLAVFYARSAGCGISDMTNAHLAAQQRDLGIIEHF